MAGDLTGENASRQPASTPPSAEQIPDGPMPKLDTSRASRPTPESTPSAEALQRHSGQPDGSGSTPEQFGRHIPMRVFNYLNGLNALENATAVKAAFQQKAVANTTKSEPS